MEIRLVIFLAFVSVTVVANTLAILIMYRLFARLTSRVTETMAEVQQNSEAREWINSMRVAAERAAVITEATKVKFAEFDPVLTRAQENYRRTLVTIDSKLDHAAEKINTTARGVRDIVAKPAFSVATFAAGISKVMESVDGKE
jgi:hypothetical protein